MKIIKQINEIRNIIPDNKKVYIYAGLSVIGCIIGKIASLKENYNLAFNCILYSSACITFEFYFMIKSIISDLKDAKKLDKEFKKSYYKLIMKKVELDLELNKDEEKFVEKYRKEQFKILKKNLYKDGKKQLKRMKKIKYEKI